MTGGMNVQCTGAGNALGIHGVVDGVGSHGGGIAGEGVGLREVAGGGAEHGEFLGGGRHFCGGVVWCRCTTTVVEDGSRSGG